MTLYDLQWHLRSNFILLDVWVSIMLSISSNFKGKDMNEKFILKYENDITKRHVTFEVKLHVMKKLPLYNDIIHTKV